jgi:hypothetical protein
MKAVPRLRHAAREKSAVPAALARQESLQPSRAQRAGLALSVMTLRATEHRRAAD